MNKDEGRWEPVSEDEVLDFVITGLWSRDQKQKVSIDEVYTLLDTLATLDKPQSDKIRGDFNGVVLSLPSVEYRTDLMELRLVQYKNIISGHIALLSEGNKNA